MTEIVLTPAACYPVYPGDRRPRARCPRRLTLDTGGSYVFRREPSAIPARMQMFHQREIVRIGEPRDRAVEWREEWRNRAAELLGSLGLRGSARRSPTTRSSGAAAGCSPPASASSS
jgi:seryl-tRNA synthetase